MKNVFKKLTVFLLVLSMLAVFGSISFAADGEKISYDVIIHVTDDAPPSAFFVDMTLIGKDAAGNDVVIDSAEKLKCIDYPQTNSILSGETDTAAIPYKLNIVADSNTAIGRTLKFDIVVKLNGVSYDLEAVVNEASKGVYTVTSGDPANFYMKTPMKVTGTYQYHSDVDFIFYEEITHTHAGVIVPGIEPTCTKSGVLQYTECAVCGKKMTDYKLLDPINHSDADNNSYCDNCNEKLADYIVSVDVLTPVDKFYDVEVKLIGRDEDGTDVVMGNMNIKDIIAAEGSYELFNGKASASLVPCKINIVTDVESAVQKALDMNINVLINNEAYETAAVINDATTTHNRITDIGDYVSVASGVPAVYHFATKGNGLGSTTKFLYHGDFDYLFAIPIELIHNHSEMIIPAVTATCTEAGSTEGIMCDICAEVLVAPETVNALGHTEEVIPAVAATCTKTGSTEGKKCAVCGEVLVAPETVNALGHTEEVIPAVTATCTEAGMTEGIKCSVCDEVLTAPEIAEATGHIDNDNDSYCDECGLQIRELTFVEKITEFFNKIINFFKNLFR